jgi:hypothetical protein
MAYVDLTGAYDKFKPQGGGFDFEENKRRREARLAKEQSTSLETNTPAFPTGESSTSKKSLQEKILSFTGGSILGRGLGLGLAQGGTKQVTDEIQKGEAEMQQKLIERIRVARAEGRDTTRLTDALKALTGGIENTGNSADDMFTEGITSKQVVGDAAQLALTSGAGYASGLKSGQLSAGKLGAKVLGKVGITAAPKTAPALVSGIAGQTSILKGAAKGALKGGLSGAGFGSASGFAQGLKQDKSIGDSLKIGAMSGVAGGVTGGLLGGIIGGASGALSKYQNRKSILQNQVDNGLRPKLSDVIDTRAQIDPKFKLIVKEAKKQGFTDSDINFLGTVSEDDKSVMQKMLDLTAKAQSNPRQITRAGDVLGENVTNQVKQVVSLNKKAGEAVDLTAKALRGQVVDVKPLGEKIISRLDDMGISINPKGELDFSESVFKNTPAVQKEIQKVIESVPDGSDAYQVHVFKKSIDEIVDYGTTGEGLKGQAKNLLKSWREAADNVLDTNFDDYNTANTSFKETRDYIDVAKGLVGKRVDLNSREGSQAFGQALRSAFSNNKSRPNTLKFIEDTHEISKRLGLDGAEKNLLDQAIFVDILEQTFGSEAATGLAGEVTKGINSALKVADAVRNPISGGLDLLAKGIEKAQNISPEQKKQILRLFIQ